LQKVFALSAKTELQDGTAAGLKWRRVTVRVARSVPFALVWLLIGTVAHATIYNYTTLNVPGAIYTAATGVSGNTVVGFYEDTPGDYLGFSESNGVYTTLNLPGPGGDTGTGIAISGSTITGTFLGIVNQVYGYYGFVGSNGSFAFLSDPNGTETWAAGIDGSTVVGYYENNSGYHGFTENGGVYTTVVDASESTSLDGISGNTIIGTLDGPEPAGFSETDGVYTILSDPADDSSSVLPAGIDGDTIVGSYTAHFDNYGFVETDGVYTALTDPAATEDTLPTGISGDTIVGSYTDESGVHGFIAAPAPEPVSLPLLALGGVSLLAHRRRRMA
jgi:hypothetical protein